MTRFDEEIQSVDQLRQFIPLETGIAGYKDIDHVDDVCRRYIALSPFVLIATRGPDGLLDISPKGDPAGFVHVLDEKTLAIPDRPGNNRLDTFENIIANPQVALIFLIPGKGDTLRVSGTAKVVRDAELAKQLAHNGREPALILIVNVEEAFTHCTKCVVRSALWKPDRWPDLTDAPKLAEAVMAHAQPDISQDGVQEIIDNSIKNKLY